MICALQDSWSPGYLFAGGLAFVIGLRHIESDLGHRRRTMRVGNQLARYPPLHPIAVARNSKTEWDRRSVFNNKISGQTELAVLNLERARGMSLPAD
jgi:hypothetical protein